MIKIIPSILTNDPDEAKEMLARCEGVRSASSGLIDRVSFDIIDGKYADNKTIDPDVLKGVETDLKLDFQLMVIEPASWVEKCVSVKQADRIIGHIEKMSSQMEFVKKVREAGIGLGVGLDLDTPVSEIDRAILSDLDVILLMSVPSGFGGQEFREEVIKKIKRLNQLREKKGYSFKIHVDGGVKPDNISRIVETGADEVSVGRRLFKGDLGENIEKFVKSAYK